MVKKAAQATPNRLLRAARKERGWTQQQVADRIGAPLSLNISRWESGTAFPSAFYIEKLCHVFGKSVRELGLSQLEGETREEPRAYATQNNDFIRLPERSLPLALTPLIGREEEVRTLSALLQRPQVRLLTLTGAGGIGKTRLALHVATCLGQEFADGIFFISLASLNEPERVLATLAQSLELKEDVSVSFDTLLKTSLHEKCLLLLLDNFERLLPAAPDLLELLIACPQLKILITSRAVLHVQGEYEFSVPPLALPDLVHLPALPILEQYSAVELFLERSQAIKHDFHLTEANAQAVAEICVRTDGLPLALELAAARIKLLSPQELLARLGSRLTVLTGGSQDLPQRQRTLRDTILWSYQLLQDREQRFLQCFSLFSNGCTLEALEAVCAAFDTANQYSGYILEVVTSLLDKSLLHIVQQEGKESRLHMLETIREYGLECLEASGKMEETRAAHARYFLQFATEAEAKLWSPEQSEWLERLEQEHDNLRSALSWSLEVRGGRARQEIALCLAVALRGFWSIRGYLSEGRAFLERALMQAEDVEAFLLIRALIAAGYHANEQGDFDQAEIWGKQCLVLTSENEDAQGFTYSLMLLGNLAMKRGENAQAFLLLEEGLARSREATSTRGINYGLISLANVFVNTGKYDQAYPLLEEALAHSRETGFVPAIVETLNLLARIALYQGDFPRARTLLEESLGLNRKVNYQDGTALALMTRGLVSLVEGELVAARSSLEAGLGLSRKGGWQERTAWGIYGLGWVAFYEKDYERARLFFEEGLMICRTLGNKVFLAFYLEGFSATVAMQGQFAWATKLWGGAQRLREEIGAAVPPFMQIPYKHFVRNFQLQMGEEMFAVLHEQGQTMELDQLLCNEVV